MSIIHLVFSLFLRALFPAAIFYEPLSNSDETDETAEMLAERYRAAESYRASAPVPPARRRPTRTGEDGRNAANRKSWYQNMSSNVQGAFDLKKFNILGLVRGKQRESQQPYGEIRKEARRQMPNKLEEVQEEPRILVNHDDQSRRLFQDTLDHCSEADAINACRALNEKISEAVLTLVDEWARAPSLSRGRSRSSSTSVLDSKNGEDLRYIIGRHLHHLVRKNRSNPPSDQVQNWVTDALHAAVAHQVSFIVSSTFCPGLPSETNRTMERTFRNMLGPESTATPLRWRALTYTYSMRDQEADENARKFTAKMENDLTYCFQSIFILAGERGSSAFVAGIGNAVKESEIIKSALDLSETLKTKFFSVCLDVYTINPDSEFREDVMDAEGNAAPEALRGRPVLCTLEIGICDVRSRDGPRRLLLKPKVALMP